VHHRWQVTAECQPITSGLACGLVLANSTGSNKPEMDPNPPCMHAAMQPPKAHKVNPSLLCRTVDPLSQLTITMGCWCPFRPAVAVMSTLCSLHTCMGPSVQACLLNRTA
jgi:hypothetical protein